MPETGGFAVLHMQMREAELTAQLRSMEEEARRAAELAAQGAPLRPTSPNVPHFAAPPPPADEGALVWASGCNDCIRPLCSR